VVTGEGATTLNLKSSLCVAGSIYSIYALPPTEVTDKKGGVTGGGGGGQLPQQVFANWFQGYRD
jgi:hypothetical protein